MAEFACSSSVSFRPQVRQVCKVGVAVSGVRGWECGLAGAEKEVALVLVLVQPPVSGVLSAVR